MSLANLLRWTALMAVVASTVVALLVVAETRPDASEGPAGAPNGQASACEAVVPDHGDAEQEARASGTREIDRGGGIIYATNDVPGTPGGDSSTLVGSGGDDRLAGEGGDDVVVGLGGADVMEGGLGDDALHGGPGDDYIEGGGPTDPAVGDRGDDVLCGGPGEDRINGWLGDDVVHGGDGDDSSLFGHEGNDTIHGGAGNDFIIAQGDGGRDEIHCGAGLDSYTSDLLTDSVAFDCEIRSWIASSGSG